MLAGESGVQGRGRPRLVFVGSLMDWAEDLPELLESRQRLWEAIRAYQGLHFQLLTKRAENIEKFLPSDWGDAGYPNVWLGVSVEDNQVSGRVAILSRIPAAVRFISYEPVLGPLSLNGSAKIDWVIAGGESGPNYRAMNLEWVRDMRNYCSQTRTAFFFKQSNGTRTEMGTTLDGETIKEFPTPRPSHCST